MNDRLELLVARAAWLPLMATALVGLACGGGEGGDAAPTDVVDDVAPRLTLVASPSGVTSDAWPHLVVGCDEDATLWLLGTCGQRSFPLSAGSNDVALASDAPWPDGVYDDCAVRAVDASGNASFQVPLPPFTIDTVAPTLAEVTPPPAVAPDGHPVVVLAVSEPGAATWAGCSGPAELAAGPAQTVTLSADDGGPLADGDYACVVTARDEAGNASAALPLTAFSVDAATPTLTLVTAPPSPGNDGQPIVTVMASEAVEISTSGPCAATPAALEAGQHTLQLAAPTGGDLPDGTLVGCTLRAVDRAGHEATLALAPFQIDTIAPVASEVVPPPALGNDPRPILELTLSEDARLSFDGDCASASTSLPAGPNAVALHRAGDQPFEDGEHLCGMQLGDDAGNASERVDLPVFVIDTVAPTLTLTESPPADGNTSVVSIVIASDDGGAVQVSGACHTNVTEVPPGSHRLSLVSPGGDPLADGVYSDCRVSVIDAAGNASDALAIPAFTVDTPMMDVLEQPPTWGNDPHPEVTVYATHAGSLSATGGCAATPDSIDAGERTIGLGGPTGGPGLADGAYTCSLTLTRVTGRSATITLPQFNVDTTPPTLTVTGPVGTTNAPTAEVTAAEDVTLGGSGCRPTPSTVTSGTHTVALVASGGGPLADGVHANCALFAWDHAGNASPPQTLAAFTVDATAPTLVETTPAVTYGQDPVRQVTLSSDEAATLTFSAGCPPADVDAVAVGETVVTFTAEGTTSVTACTVTATDAVGNASSLHLSAFHVGGSGFVEHHKKSGEAVIYEDIERTPDGGYLVVSGNTISKLDGDMVPVWNRELSGVYPRAVAIGPSGYAIVTGTTSGDIGVGFGDAFLMRVEANGDIAWAKAYGLPNTPDDLNGVTIYGQGAILAVGRTYVHNNGGHQGWVIHADTDGTAYGSKVYGGAGYEEFNDVASWDGASKRIVGRVADSTQSQDDPLLVEIWNTGEVWEARRFTATFDDDFRAVATGPNGVLYAIGRTVSFHPTAYDDPVYYNGLVAKIDFFNELVWTRSIGGVATSVMSTGAGVVVGGYAYDYGDDWNEGEAFPDYTEGSEMDGFLVAFDHAGEAAWARIVETGTKTEVRALVEAAGGGLAAVGYVRWPGIWDYGLVAKLDAGGDLPDNAACDQLRRIPADHSSISVSLGTTSPSVPVADLAVSTTTINPAQLDPFLFQLTPTPVCD